MRTFKALILIVFLIVFCGSLVAPSNADIYEQAVKVYYMYEPSTVRWFGGDLLPVSTAPGFGIDYAFSFGLFESAFPVEGDDVRMSRADYYKLIDLLSAAETSEESTAYVSELKTKPKAVNDPAADILRDLRPYFSLGIQVVPHREISNNIAINNGTYLPLVAGLRWRAFYTGALILGGLGNTIVVGGDTMSGAFSETGMVFGLDIGESANFELVYSNWGLPSDYGILQSNASSAGSRFSFGAYF